MKTSRIKNVVSVKPHTNNNGTTYYHNLEMENGDKINLGKKKEQQIGWELTYEIIEEGQQEFNKAKAVAPEGFKSGGFKNGYTDKDKIRMAKSVAIKSASIYFQQREGKLNDIKKYADFCYDYIVSEVKVEPTNSVSATKTFDNMQEEIDNIHF